MNDKELIGKVHSAVYHQCQRRGYAAPVDVLMEIGVLPKQKYEDWRFGRVDYLERVCMVNLRKLSFIMRQMRVYAQKTGLKPSFCYYKQWGVKKKNGQGHKPVIPLRFSKSGDLEIEKWYATHFVDSKKAAELEEPKPHGKSYNKWLGDRAKPSHREQLRMMIDQALEQKPADFDALLKLLAEMGCEVSRRGQAIRLKALGWKNVARMDEKLGQGYSEDEIRAVLAGKKEHTPRKKPAVQTEPPKVNLLVDIQAKLQAGKGAGYARWAKVFNLKQMAQTMNYLTEHGLLEYAVLEEKAAAATTRHNELSAQIKAAETRMAEIAVLRTHIINYVKTREVYAAYRKAGYSKKFLAEHEADILLHKAAKQAFDDLGIKKLPTVKSLQAEYAQLLEGKKKDYAEYRRSREEMRELLAAKANVDRLMGYGEERRNDREKEQGQDR